MDGTDRKAIACLRQLFPPGLLKVRYDYYHSLAPIGRRQPTKGNIGPQFPKRRVRRKVMCLMKIFPVCVNEKKRKHTKYNENEKCEGKKADFCFDGRWSEARERGKSRRFVSLSFSLRKSFYFMLRLDSMLDVLYSFFSSSFLLTLTLESFYRFFFTIVLFGWVHIEYIQKTNKLFLLFNFVELHEGLLITL